MNFDDSAHLYVLLQAAGFAALVVGGAVFLLILILTLPWILH